MTTTQTTTTRTMPTETTLLQIEAQMLRVIAGVEPVESVRPWLAAFHPGSADGNSRPGRILALAMGSRDPALLAVVLDHPSFCPTERHRAPHSSMASLHGPDLFNGGLTMVAVDPTMMGRLSAPVAWVWNDWAQRYALPAGPDAPQVPGVPTAVKTAAEVWGTRMRGAGHHHTYGAGVREQDNVNIVGQAVMMGWSDGVQVLLDHGVEPYARQGYEHSEASARTFVSPVVLAAHYGEVDCLKVLLAHPSFELHGRHAPYGHDEAAWGRLKDKPRRAPWTHRSRHGGLEIEFVLESPEAMQQPEVRARLRAVVAGLSRTRMKRLSDPGKGLSEAAFRVLEGLVLEQTAQDCMPTSTVTRARSRL